MVGALAFSKSALPTRPSLRTTDLTPSARSRRSRFNLILESGSSNKPPSSLVRKHITDWRNLHSFDCKDEPATPPELVGTAPAPPESADPLSLSPSISPSMQTRATRIPGSAPRLSRLPRQRLLADGVLLRRARQKILPLLMPVPTSLPRQIERDKAKLGLQRYLSSTPAVIEWTPGCVLNLPFFCFLQNSFPLLTSQCCPPCLEQAKLSGSSSSSRRSRLLSTSRDLASPGRKSGFSHSSRTLPSSRF